MKSYLAFLIVSLLGLGLAAQPAMTMGAGPNASPMPADGAADMPVSPHMRMLHANVPPSADDRARAAAILQTLRATMAKYQDYRLAERDGYLQYLPQIPQPVYHFTNWKYAFEALYGFDPSKPTSLMYKIIPGGYRLIGAMYTAPVEATAANLDARVPLSVGTWHEHVNVCFPPAGMRWKMLQATTQFGLAGSITTAAACSAAGGTFKPVIFNWMLHVWPYETEDAKIWKATAR